MQDISITLTDGNLVSEPDVTKFHLTGLEGGRKKIYSATLK